MKFLIFGLAFIASVYFCAGQAPTLEQLVARASALEVNATAEVAALRAANRTAAANELAREERVVRLLTAEILRLNATATEAELRRLEGALNLSEQTLAAEIRRLSTAPEPPTQANTLQTLLTRATALEARATAEIAVLTAANRTAAAAGLQRQETQIATLVTEIQALPANASEAELRRLEVRLAEVEAAVTVELRLLGAPPATGTTGTTGRFRRQAVTRESLIARGEALITRARADVAALRAAGRTAEATRLEGEVRVIETLVTDLRNLRTTALTEAELRVLENALNEAENRFEAELARIESSSTF